jgi:hypothetical protein
MAKILSSKKITQATIETYIEKATTSYSTFLNSTPLFVTYFSQDSLRTSFDSNTQNYSEAIGNEGSVIYNKVESVPLYKVDISSFDSQIEEDLGSVIEIESSGIMLPNTITPLVDDMIEIDFMNKVRVFRVTDVQFDLFNNTKYYKIKFALSNFNKQDLDKQINDELVLDYSLIGKKENVLINKNYALLGGILEELFDFYLTAYKEAFYDSSLSLFTTTLESTKYVSTSLNRFIKAEKLHVTYKGYRDFLHINTDIVRKLDTP